MDQNLYGSDRAVDGTVIMDHWIVDADWRIFWFFFLAIGKFSSTWQFGLVNVYLNCLFGRKFYYG